MQDDDQWLASVRHGHPAGEFGHREHLRLAWLALSEFGDVTLAQLAVSETIRRLAAAQGVPQRYNRTVTDAWVRILAHCREVAGTDSLDAVLTTFPWLLDKRLLMQHYRSRTLASQEARREWVEPDLVGIP